MSKTLGTPDLWSLWLYYNIWQFFCVILGSCLKAYHDFRLCVRRCSPWIPIPWWVPMDTRFCCRSERDSRGKRSWPRCRTLIDGTKRERHQRTVTITHNCHNLWHKILDCSQTGPFSSESRLQLQLHFWKPWGEAAMYSQGSTWLRVGLPKFKTIWQWANAVTHYSLTSGVFYIIWLIWICLPCWDGMVLHLQIRD